MDARKKSQRKIQPHETFIQLLRNAATGEQMALQTLTPLKGALEKLGLSAIIPPLRELAPRRSNWLHRSFIHEFSRPLRP